LSLNNSACCSRVVDLMAHPHIQVQAAVDGEVWVASLPLC
jgi:hypothetical protein